jgi:hypothetical protein
MIRLKLNLFYSIIFTIIIFLYVLPVETVFVKTYTISTVVGVPGSSAASANNLPGTSTFLVTPYGIWISTNGRLYIADSGAQVIRTVDTTQGRQALVTAFAGAINNAGSSGDSGLASNAKLSTPSGVCGDTIGNIYIMDSGNLQVRKVNTLGIISIVSGRTGTTGCVDGGSGQSNFINPFMCQVDQNGDVLIVDSGCHCIRRLATATNILTTIIGALGVSGTSEGIGTNAKLNTPRGFFLDSNGNFFIADSGNNRIRKIPAGFTSTSITIAGSANGGGNNVVASSLVNLFSAPQGIWCDRLGNKFITDPGNDWIREINATTGFITSPVAAGSDLSDNIIALGARLRSPVGIIGDSLGNIYFSDSQDCAVRKLTLGAPISPFPTLTPTFAPTRTPSAPTKNPTVIPTVIPTFVPTTIPTKTPSFEPSTIAPSFVPSTCPTMIPSTVPSNAPTMVPSATPTVSPTATPTVLPTLLPVASPTSSPIPIPTFAPTRVPTTTHTYNPTTTPTTLPTLLPVATPTSSPIPIPTFAPTRVPTATLTYNPTTTPTTLPTLLPIASPTSSPIPIPTFAPTRVPTATPTYNPTFTLTPTRPPTKTPIANPTRIPTKSPVTIRPTTVPTYVPTFFATMALG